MEGRSRWKWAETDNGLMGNLRDAFSDKIDFIQPNDPKIAN